MSQAYGGGTCRQNPSQCTVNGETYEAGGDRYCTGGPSADTCCCQPTTTTTTTSSTTTYATTTTSSPGVRDEPAVIGDAVKTKDAAVERGWLTRIWEWLSELFT